MGLTNKNSSALTQMERHNAGQADGNADERYNGLTTPNNVNQAKLHH